MTQEEIFESLKGQKTVVDPPAYSQTCLASIFPGIGNIVIIKRIIPLFRKGEPRREGTGYAALCIVGDLEFAAEMEAMEPGKDLLFHGLIPLCRQADHWVASPSLISMANTILAKPKPLGKLQAYEHSLYHALIEGIKAANLLPL